MIDTPTIQVAHVRHRHFLLFLMRPFQKAALLMFSQRLVEAIKRLDVNDLSSKRRQANTVVTILGLVGTVSTGTLGMNLLAEADSP